MCETGFTSTLKFAPNCTHGHIHIATNTSRMRSIRSNTFFRIEALMTRFRAVCSSTYIASEMYRISGAYCVKRHGFPAPSNQHISTSPS